MLTMEKTDLIQYEKQITFSKVNKNYPIRKVGQIDNSQD